ncbi:hypothetical protein IG631_00762 [Alternaria alternata]|nr:hypothetical protein IG631_00762 [Alternaria alternata]
MTRDSESLRGAAVDYAGLALSRVKSWRMLSPPRATNHHPGTGGFIDRVFFGIRLRITHRYTFHHDSCTWGNRAKCDHAQPSSTSPGLSVH